MLAEGLERPDACVMVPHPPKASHLKRGWCRSADQNFLLISHQITPWSGIIKLHSLAT